MEREKVNDQRQPFLIEFVFIGFEGGFSSVFLGNWSTSTSIRWNFLHVPPEKTRKKSRIFVAVVCFFFFLLLFFLIFFLCEEGGKSVGARARPSAASVASVWVVLTFFFFFSCCFFFHLIFISFFFSRPHSESLPAGSHIPQKKTEFQWQNSVTKNPFWEQTKKKRQVNPVHYVKNPVMLSTEPRKKNGVFFSFFF